MVRWLSLSLAMATLAGAQTPAIHVEPYRARILGVLDANTGNPIEEARVTAVGTGTWAATTKTGTVSLAFLVDGGDSVTVRKAGYRPAGLFISISPSDTTPVTVILVPTENVLPAVITRDTAPHYISPGLKEFEERRKTGFGQFVTEAQLRKSDGRQMSEVIRQLHGIRIRCNTRVPFVCTAENQAATALEGKQCTMLMYVDGVRNSDVNLLNLRVEDYAGIEAYTGARAPVRYNATGSGCGVLLFWSRER